MLKGTLWGGLLALVLLISGVPGGGAPPAAAAPLGVAARPPVGHIDAAMKARLRTVWQTGQARGRRANVLAKVGDSITSSGSFLSDIGDGNAVLGSHRELAPIVAYYRAMRVDRLGRAGHNSLNRQSLAAHPSWTGAEILSLPGTWPDPAPLAQEYAAINPAVAVIMLGTNDLDRTGVDFFGQNLAAIVETSLQAGVIPVLSTIPDRQDSPQAAARTLVFNDAIRAEAAVAQVPLIDYWAALQSLPRLGLQADLVHPSIYPAARGYQASVTFTDRALRYGWNVRNFLTLQMLARLKAIVFDNGRADQ